ncbi:hypothetical protein B1N54_16965 [Listeria monocytogenes]|nr:hypothetical protein [Listeria monocytogenes]EAC3851721.1 hypothetical protein [Listeria monocytogenes]EAC5359557.1 hypothetical protein [Listeria monocytogenes]EAC5363228.1 hypothetical protein [Listeria monocytogenes]EAC9270769.1 hypothetical protein [Listeria monocytogenes]
MCFSLQYNTAIRCRDSYEKAVGYCEIYSIGLQNAFITRKILRFKYIIFHNLFACKTKIILI